MIEATCTDCGTRFYRQADEAWKRRCLSCWKASKAGEKPEAGEFLRGYRAGYEAGQASASAGSGPEPTALDKARVRQLLQLCHPDKHGGSDLAQRVTQWLNEIKRGALRDA